jgi:protein-L-isoaspartate O-methyltransferase
VSPLREDETLAALEAAPARTFVQRVRVLDRLEQLAWLRSPSPDGTFGNPVGPRITALEAKLTAANERFLDRLRRRIAAGRVTSRGLLRALRRREDFAEGKTGYDALDLLVAGLFEGDAQPEIQDVPEQEMVFYQPTPVRSVLALIDRAGIGPGDTFVDVGAGLGHVVLLVRLLTGARVRGLELEEGYCTHARRVAARLSIQDAVFDAGDAREAPLEGGTVYFLYTPFRGALLAQVLERLQTLARDRDLRICTLGPCTQEVARAGWLRPGPEGVLGEHQVTVFLAGPLDSVRPPVA